MSVRRYALVVVASLSVLLVAPNAAADPDLFITSDLIEFLSKNGDTTPFSTAAVGDEIEVKAQIGNAKQADPAFNVRGQVFIELGFDRILLGTFSVPTLAPGDFADVDLIPNLSLPSPPKRRPGGIMVYDVTDPSPWLQVFTYEILTVDSTPANNVAGKPLQVIETAIPTLGPIGAMILMGTLLLLGIRRSASGSS